MKKMDSVLFRSEDAQITGLLKILDWPVAYTIHYWNNINDTISWVWANAKPANYHVSLNYSLDKALTGGIFSLVVGNQQLVVEAKPTDSWHDFKTFDVGVIKVEKTDNLPVELRALQLPDKMDAAMPDLVWLSLTPKKAINTSQPFNTLTSKFSSNQ